MPPPKKFHLVFSIIMGAMMVFVVTFVITLANMGWNPGFLSQWSRAFAIAYLVAVPVIFFIAPVARKITGKLLNMPA